VETKRAALLEAVKKKKVMERLKEKHLAEFRWEIGGRGEETSTKWPYCVLQDVRNEHEEMVSRPAALRGVVFGVKSLPWG
jgi:hypothetical protein